MELTERLALKENLAQPENLVLPDPLDLLVLLEKVEKVAFLEKSLTNHFLDPVDQQDPPDSLDKKVIVVFQDLWDLMVKWDLKELWELLDLKDLSDLEARPDPEDHKVSWDRPVPKEISANLVFQENRDDLEKRVLLEQKVLGDPPEKTVTKDQSEQQDQLVTLDHLEFQESRV